MDIVDAQVHANMLGTAITLAIYASILATTSWTATIYGDSDVLVSSILLCFFGADDAVDARGGAPGDDDGELALSHVGAPSVPLDELRR